MGRLQGRGPSHGHRGRRRVKGCLSLQSVKTTEGNVRTSALADIWLREGAFAYNRSFSLDDLSGFCHRCAYAQICRGGCTSARTCEGGVDNPFCYHRVATLALEKEKAWVRRALSQAIAPAALATLVGLGLGGCSSPTDAYGMPDGDADGDSDADQDIYGMPDADVDADQDIYGIPDADVDVYGIPDADVDDGGGDWYGMPDARRRRLRNAGCRRRRRRRGLVRHARRRRRRRRVLVRHAPTPMRPRTPMMTTPARTGTGSPSRPPTASMTRLRGRVFA